MDTSSQPLSILIQCNELPPHSTGGIGVQTLNMAYALHAAGRQVTIIGIYNEVKKHEHPFCFIQLQRIKKLGFLGHLINVFRFQYFLFQYIVIQKNKVDVIEYPDYEGYGCFTFVNTPRIVRLNHPGFYVHGKYAGAKWFEITKCLRWWMIRRSINKADKTIAVAAYLVPIIKALSKPKKMAVVYNLTAVSPNEIPTTSANNNAITKDYILNFGTIAPYKGIDLLVSAFMNIADQLSFDLRLAGRISDAAIFKAANEFRSTIKGNQIIFLGELSQKELMPNIQNAKAIIFPSLQENMPLAWAEAMGMGKAIWVSDIPVASEMIINGVDGFIFEKKNTPAIEKALLQIENMEKEQLEKISQPAQDKYHQHFSTKVLQNKNIACFQSVICP